MPKFYSPQGNVEIWAKKPDGYFTPEEWEARHPAPQPEPPTLAEAKAQKLAEIIAGANRVKATLSAQFSVLEESTWPEQEAGACAILNRHDEVNNVLARLILQDSIATQRAMAVVQGLATQDQTTPEAFAARIMANAKTASDTGLLSLMEQRGFEQATNAATTVKAVDAIKVEFTVLKQVAG